MKGKTFLRTLVLSATLAFAACTSTVTPLVVHPGQASYDGSTQNSGIVEVVTDGGASGWVVTARARDRYNALVERYGKTMWSPAIEPDHGVTPDEDGRYRMTDEAMSKFVAMAEKARMSGE